MKKFHLGKTAPAAILAAIFLSISVPSPALARRVVVFGLDETGSYDYRPKAIEIAKGVIKDLDPGDVLYFRRITEDSYSQGAHVFRLEIPAALPEPGNKFDPRARAAWKKSLAKAEQAKAASIEYLSKLPVINPSHTDIWGFFVAASERFAIEGGNAIPIIIVATDGDDNVRRKATANLGGVKIYLAGFEGGSDPRRTRALRDRWSKNLTEMKAASVIFLPPDAMFTIKTIR